MQEIQHVPVKTAHSALTLRRCGALGPYLSITGNLMAPSGFYAVLLFAYPSSGVQDLLAGGLGPRCEDRAQSAECSNLNICDRTKRLCVLLPQSKGSKLMELSKTENRSAFAEAIKRRDGARAACSEWVRTRLATPKTRSPIRRESASGG